MPNASVNLHDFLWLPWELTRGLLVEDLQGVHESIRELQNSVFGEATDSSFIQHYETSGTEHNFVLGNNAKILTVSNSNANFTGFADGTDGRELTIVYTGSGSCKVHHQSNSSVINWRIECPSVNGLVVGQGGAIRLIYDVDRWRAFTIAAGKPITPTFAAGDYTAATGNWTVASGDVAKFTYQQINKLVMIDFSLTTTSVSATPATLNRAVPAGFTITSNSFNPCLTNNNGTQQIGVVKAEQSSNLLKFYSTGALAGWATATDNTGLSGQLTFEVN